MDVRMTEKAEREQEEIFALTHRAWQLLDIICMEFKTDPQSVACFDMRIVNEAIKITTRRRAIRDFLNPWTGI